MTAATAKLNHAIDLAAVNQIGHDHGDRRM
jgi:hypothetical protein